VGYYSPSFRTPTAEVDEEFVRGVDEADPDIMWIGPSTLRQERWMAAHVGRVGHAGRLTAPVMGAWPSITYAQPCKATVAAPLPKKS
jgi:N-acetylglucosaminyldiphosphoundecaprenol N-acetyl-beta-D-mannosaminyltransferase